MLLVEDFGDLTGTYGAATFADSEAETLVASNRSDELDDNLNVVTRHYHFYALGESDLTGNIQSTDVELGTVVVVEGSVTATFFFLQDIDRSLELGVGLNDTGVADNHTALDVFLVDTTEEETNVVTGFTLIEELAEHFDTSYGGLHVCAKTHNLNFVADLNDTGFDTTGGNSTTTGNREHVFNRHQEGLVDVAGRQGDPVVNSVHQLNNLSFPFGLTVESAESGAADDGSFVAVVFVG